MTWRHLNFFQHQAYLNARVPRVRCNICGVKTSLRALGATGQRLHAVAVAAALASAFTITEFRQFHASRSRIGEPVCGDLWRYTWRVNAPR